MDRLLQRVIFINRHAPKRLLKISFPLPLFLLVLRTIVLIRDSLFQILSALGRRGFLAMVVGEVPFPQVGLVLDGFIDRVMILVLRLQDIRIVVEVLQNVLFNLIDLGLQGKQ